MRLGLFDGIRRAAPSLPSGWSCWGSAEGRGASKPASLPLHQVSPTSGTPLSIAPATAAHAASRLISRGGGEEHECSSSDAAFCATYEVELGLLGGGASSIEAAIDGVPRAIDGVL